MIRILYIAILALPLCAFQCEGPAAENLMAAVFGADVAAKTALPSHAMAVEMYSTLVSSEEPSVELVAAVEPEVVEPSSEYVPTAHVTCYETPWRDTFQTICETQWY